MKVDYARQARRDLQQISSYIRHHSPQGADNVLKRIRGAIRQLADYPQSGEITDMPDVRHLYIGRYPYVVFYLLTPNAIRILHVRHTSRGAADTVFSLND